MKLIDRITNANASIKFKKFEDDYARHLKFKKQIQKQNPIPIERIVLKKKKM